MLGGTLSTVWEFPESVRPFLHDPTLPHLGISACFLVTLGALLVACFRARAVRSDRVRWAWLTAGMTALLVNQQSDFQTPLLQTLGGLAQYAGVDTGSTLVSMLTAAAYALVCTGLALSLVGSAPQGKPPGDLGVIGLGLILAHGVGRGATFLGLLDGPFAVNQLHTILAILEVVGLTLLAIAALRYRVSAPVDIRPQSQVRQMA